MLQVSYTDHFVGIRGIANLSDMMNLSFGKSQISNLQRTENPYFSHGFQELPDTSAYQSQGRNRSPAKVT